MNKGLQIRANKHKKQAEKKYKVLEEQEGLCRFIAVEWVVFNKVNGKMRAVGKSQSKGLQVENKVYLIDGSYKFLNKKSIKIKEVFEGVPTWATEELQERYYKNLHEN